MKPDLVPVTSTANTATTTPTSATDVKIESSMTELDAAEWAQELSNNCKRAAAAAAADRKADGQRDVEEITTNMTAAHIIALCKGHGEQSTIFVPQTVLPLKIVMCNSTL